MHLSMYSCIHQCSAGENYNYFLTAQHLLQRHHAFFSTYRHRCTYFARKSYYGSSTYRHRCTYFARKSYYGSSTYRHRCTYFAHKSIYGSPVCSPFASWSQLLPAVGWTSSIASLKIRQGRCLTLRQSGYSCILELPSLKRRLLGTAAITKVTWFKIMMSHTYQRD